MNDLVKEDTEVVTKHYNKNNRLLKKTQPIIYKEKIAVPIPVPEPVPVPEPIPEPVPVHEPHYEEHGGYEGY